MAAPLKATRGDVYASIDAERDYQDAVGLGPDGREDGDTKHVGDYLTVARALLVEADACLNGRGGEPMAMHAIRKIAATCVQAMEVHGASPREQ